MADTNDALSRELAPVPTSMFADSGDVRIFTSKFKMKAHLQERTSFRRHRMIQRRIVGGSAVLLVVIWPSNGIARFIVNVKGYISNKLSHGNV